MWDKSYANELGRLCQGIGTGTKPGTNCVDGTNIFFLIKYDDIPTHNQKEICHILVICVVQPEKNDPDCTWITIGGSKICYPGDISTNMASLELIKILLNSVLSCKGACFSCIDLKNFYLDTPMLEPEHVRVKISDIQAEFIEEYDLVRRDCNGWIYYKIRQGCYGLPQAGILANNLLCSCLVIKGYYESAFTPGLWHHKWHPIQFCLTMDNLVVEYVGIKHFRKLLDLLKNITGSNSAWLGTSCLQGFTSIGTIQVDAATSA